MSDLERHTLLLSSLCRVCSRSISRYDKTSYNVVDISEDINITFLLSTMDDKEEIHPKKICQKCMYQVENFKKVKSIPTLTPVQWYPHTSTDCVTCSLAVKVAKGGRPKKNKAAGRGRPKQITAVSDIMGLNPRRPIPSSVEKCLSHVMSIKMANSNLPNNSVQIKTNGPQPITLTPVSVPRKDSQNVAPRTLRKRTKSTKSIIRMIAGETDEAFSAQTVELVKSLDEKRREEVIKKLKVKATVPDEHVAAMKATLNIPWALLREIRSWMKTFNVQIASEGKVRKVATEWVGKGLIAEYAPLFVKKGKKSVVHPTPWCYLFNIVGHVMARMDNLQKCNAIVNHPFIPSDEVHLKIGGDHGGGSFKMSYQIGNVNHPNNLQNTVIFSIFNEKDSRANLRICLDRFKPQIQKLDSVRWNDKRIRTFMFGDYEFLCAVYGLTGANGKYPCLFCTISSTDMQLPKGTSGIELFPRTLQNLKEHFTKFVAEYDQNKKYAKECFNVIDDVFFNVPLKQVCLPGLHMTLGIYMKIFRDIIERFCQEMDTKILESTIASGCSNYYADYENYLSLLKERKQLNNEIRDLEASLDSIQDELDWLLVKNEKYDKSNHEMEIEELSNNIEVKQKQLNVIDLQVKEEDVEGPCIKSLDVILNEIGVHRQAYYGNTIIGNHCHTLLKEKNIEKLCKNISDFIFRELGEGELYRNSLIETGKMMKLLKSYSDCHSIFNCARHVTNEEVLLLQNNIKKFMDYFRLNWPNINISPKLHLLEYHTSDFVQLWGTGCGFYGEQGAESAHHGINRMKHNYTIRNDLQKLEYIMNQHLLSTNPKAQTIKPSKKTRRSRK